MKIDVEEFETEVLRGLDRPARARCFEFFQCAAPHHEPFQLLTSLSAPRLMNSTRGEPGGSVGSDPGVRLTICSTENGVCSRPHRLPTALKSSRFCAHWPRSSNGQSLPARRCHPPENPLVV